MKRWCRRLLAFSLFAFVMAFVATAAAAPSRADIARRRAYDAGVAAYRAQQYDKALEQFKKSLPLPEGRRGIALTLDVMGRSAEAADEFEKFIAVAPASMAENVKKARDRVAQIRAGQQGQVDPNATVRPAKIRVVTVPAGATITVVGQPANGISPVELDLPPGKYRVHAVLDEYEAGEREIEVTSGSFSQVDFELVPSAKLGASTPVDVAVVGREANARGGGSGPAGPSVGASHWIAPIVSGTVAAGALGAGVIFGISALDKKSDYDKDPTDAKLADAESTAALSTVGFVAGGVLAIATVALILFGEESAPAGGKAAAAGPGTLRFAF